MRLLLFVLLAGCATQQYAWQKVGASEQDFYMDRGQCNAQAMANHTPPGSMQWAMIFASCMQGKGWYRVAVQQ